MNLAGGSLSSVSGGRSRTRPLEPFLLEARLATRLELDHLCRARRLEVWRRNPNDVQVHSSLLSLGDGCPAAPRRAPEAGWSCVPRDRDYVALRNRSIRVVEQARQDSNPGVRGWSSPCCRYTTGLCRSGRPGSNGPLRSGAPVLCRLSYVRASMPGWDRTSVRLPSQRRALSSTELRASIREPPAGVEPAPRPYKGRVLAVDTTEA